jgi:hypothetical protein
MYRASGSNPNTFVFNLDGLPREAANRRSQQRRVQQNNQAPTTHTVTIDTGYFHCQEHRSFYPNFNYEIVQIQTTDRNHDASTPSDDAFYILNFPIDQLSEHPGLVEEAIRLNPRRIALCNPLSSDMFLNNYRHISERTLTILRRVVSLTKITLCVDILNDALFDILCNQSHLREIEIILPSPTSLKGSAHVRQVLNRGYALVDRLPQVEFFKIPLKITHSFPNTVKHYLTPIP